MTKYVDAAEQAKLVRKMLKEAFPGVKFSVRTSKYAGGASITVRWDDGPTAAQVDALLKPMEGAYFDGMTDYKGYRDHMLDGQRVSFGANFIFAERRYSDRMKEKGLAALRRRNPHLPLVQNVTLEDLRNGGGWNLRPEGTNALVYRNARLRMDCCADNLQEALFGQLNGMTECPTKPCPTAKRFVFTGDDGYGYGAVGRRAHLELVQ